MTSADDETTALRDALVVVAGAGGAAGPAVAKTLTEAGAQVVLADHRIDKIRPLAESLNAALGPPRTGRPCAHPMVVDLGDEAATRRWADQLVAQFGRVDGLVHLVGGWRGGTPLRDVDLHDWEWLAERLVRTVQHTSKAFHDPLLAARAGRFVLVSATAAHRPQATAAAYAAAKAAAEAWTLALADAFTGTSAAAVIVVVRALVTAQMRQAEPQKSFEGYTDVDTLAAEIANLWRRPAAEVNGTRLWLAE